MGSQTPSTLRSVYSGTVLRVGASDRRSGGGPSRVTGPPGADANGTSASGVDAVGE